MNFYPYLVFLHVAAAMCAFVALGIETVTLPALRRAESLDGVRTLMGFMHVPARLGSMSALALLVTGVWMMAWVWGHPAWIEAGIGALVLIGALSGAVTGRAMRRLGRALADETGPVPSPSLRALQNAHELVLSTYVRIALGIAALLLMTLKPGTAASYSILGGSLVVGWGMGVLSRRPAALTSPASQ